MPIKAWCWDISLAIWDFGWSNNHSTHLSTTKTICYLTSFLQCSHLYQLRFPILICNKSAADAWICLVSEVVVTGVLQKKLLLKISSWSLFLIKLQVFSTATLLKRDSNTGVFNKICNFSSTPILNNICKQLLL